MVIPYEYLGKFGDCVDLNTFDDTWYIYPDPDRCEFAVTKMALATEELYFRHRRVPGMYSAMPEARTGPSRCSVLSDAIIS